MHLRKLSANFVFDGKSRMIRNGILTADAEGRILELRDPGNEVREEAGVEFYNGILLPGFINTHCHLELSHMKGKIERGGGLAHFLPAVIKGRAADPEEILTAMKRADEAMFREGIVACGDISNTAASFGIKAESRIRYHTFIELFGPENKRAGRIFDGGTELAKTARADFGLSVSLTPHSAYSVSEELFRRIAADLPISTPLSVHNQESGSENDFVNSAAGELYKMYEGLGLDLRDMPPRHMSSLSWLLKMAGTASRLLLVHNSFTSSADLKDPDFNADNTWWTLCPASNQYISGTAPNRLLIERFPGRVCTGTDSLASNDRLSVLEELKQLQLAFPGLSAPELLRFGCHNGAAALAMEDQLGRFNPGMKPGIHLLVKADLLNMKIRPETGIKVLIPGK